MRLQGLPPDITPSTRTLIIGTFPGALSLEKKEYYAHPRNRFWRVMADVYRRADLLAMPYQERMATLSGYGVGLWDLYASVERKGSEDKNIRNAVKNDLHAFIADHGKINRIVENGKNARIEPPVYSALVRGMGVAIECAPSTSPANCQWSLDALVARWRSCLGLSDAG